MDHVRKAVEPLDGSTSSGDAEADVASEAEGGKKVETISVDQRGDAISTRVTNSIDLAEFDAKMANALST